MFYNSFMHFSPISVPIKLPSPRVVGLCLKLPAAYILIGENSINIQIGRPRICAQRTLLRSPTNTYWLVCKRPNRYVSLRNVTHRRALARNNDRNCTLMFITQQYDARNIIIIFFSCNATIELFDL